MKAMLLALAACHVPLQQPTIYNHVGGKPPAEVVWIDTWVPQCRTIKLPNISIFKCWYVKKT